MNCFLDVVNVHSSRTARVPTPSSPCSHIAKDGSLSTVSHFLSTPSLINFDCRESSDVVTKATTSLGKTPEEEQVREATVIEMTVGLRLKKISEVLQGGSFITPGWHFHTKTRAE